MNTEYYSLKKKKTYFKKDSEYLDKFSCMAKDWNLSLLIPKFLIQFFFSVMITIYLEKIRQLLG